MTPVTDFDPQRRTNAQAIADLARLGILLDTDHVLDATCGQRKFWSDWRPAKLSTNDLDKSVKAQHHWDATQMPVDDRSFDVVVFDPPYANRGTSRHKLDADYGLGEYRSPREVEMLLVRGTVEALRVCDRLAIIKCQDATVSARYRPQTFAVWQAATKAGARIVAELYVIGRREQPAGKAESQRSVWSACSTMMVFERGRR